MRRYAIVIWNAGTNLAAYVPDLPGCAATASPSKNSIRLMGRSHRAAPGGDGGRRPADPEPWRRCGLR